MVEWNWDQTPCLLEWTVEQQKQHMLRLLVNQQPKLLIYTDYIHYDGKYNSRLIKQLSRKFRV